ncbi:Immunoglobulin-like fold [Phytophthora cactorum]|nr:Immunoglobulin-like fold [Phytophthora cactorum]
MLVFGLLLIAVANAAFFTPGDVPDPPEKILVSPASDTSMRVQFYPPLNVKPEGVNGAPVLGGSCYDGVPGFYPEVWEIVSTESSGTKVLGGTFDLSIGFEGQWTNTNPCGWRRRVHGSRHCSVYRLGITLDSYHVRGVTVATTIQVMDTALGNVQVTKTSNSVTTSSDFSSKIADGEQVQIGSKVFKVTNVAINSLTLDAAWTDDTTLHITAFARKKATLSVNAEAAEMKRALSALPGVGSIDVSRIGPTKSNGMVVSFQSVGGAVINFDDTAADVRTKLQSLATVGRLNVTRSENSDFGATWTITFLSNMGDLPPLVVYDKTLLKGTGVNVAVQEIVKGVDVALETIIEGLDPGQDYYVRAFARNENGYGEYHRLAATWTRCTASSNSLDHGDPVSKYLFEYAVGDTFGKLLPRKFSSLILSRTTSLALSACEYGDDVTSMLSVHTTASSLQRALNSLPSVRPVSVSRALYVLTGSPSVTFTAANNQLTTPTLTGVQCMMLEKGARHGVDFTVNKDLLKLDSSGSERGPYGYIWTISFDNDAGDVVHGKYPGLQLLSSLTSVDTSLALPVSSYGVALGQTGIPADHYGFFEINNDEEMCNTYVVGAPSSVQVVRLFAPTTATDGTFKLKLGSETTADCITLGKSGTLSTMKKNLEALDLVSKVTVDEVRAFKVTTTSTVTDYDNTGNLPRNPNDFSRHSCEFVVDTAPAAGVTKISVTPRGSCDYFTGESRILKILDFHDYQVRFLGYYPTGEWPTLQFDYSEFGTGTCTPWAPLNLQVYGQVHTVKYEGVCSKGQDGVQTILADASSTIGGTFTLSYMGEVTSPLSFRDTGAGEMRDAIDSITAPGTVNVSVSQYGAYGKAWHVTFAKDQDDDEDAIFIQHSRLTGQNALISVYPTVTVFTDAKQNDISGSFRITISGETTEPIGFSATHMKVTQELQKLSVVDSVVALGDKSAGDTGVYALELTADATASSSRLTNIKLGGTLIDLTRFLAIGETLVLGSPPSSYTIKSMTPFDITLSTAFPASATSKNYDVLAGLITKQTKPLPGYVGISSLMQDLRKLVKVGDDLWLPSVSADMNKYTVTAVDKRYLEVRGSFTEPLRERKQHNWRGTTLGSDRSPKAVSANVVNVGNPASTQTILLEVRDVLIATPKFRRPVPTHGCSLGEFHGPTWLSINYWAPFYSGGARVTMYRIEWDSSPNFDSSSRDYGVTSIQETYEVQQVITSYRSAGAGGTFSLSWGGRKTSALPFDCSEAEMTDALAIITDTSNVADDPVKVTRDELALGVVELVQGFSDLAIGDFTHEVQEVFTDGVYPVGGSFTLTFNGKNTGTILVSASALEMQAALQVTTSSYSIKVTKTVRNAALNSAIWSVTFAYLRGEEMVGAGNIFTMTVASSQLTGTNAVVRVANKVTGSDPSRFTVTDLRPGVKYFAHVMAYNADGFGSANSPLASAVTCSQPPAPQSVTASVVDGTTLQVDWSASTASELCSVDKYKVEWYRAEGTQEQQTITTSAGKGIPEIQRLVNFADSQTLSGYFKLSFGGEMTENIRWDAAAIGLNSVKERLERLSTVGTVDVFKADSTRVVGGLLVTATSMTVTVHGTSTSTIGDSKLAQGDVIWIAGNKRTIMAAVSVTDTTLTIDTALEITVPVPVFKRAYGYEWKITFLAGHVGPQELVQTALESLVTIGAVNVTRSANGYGYNWVITFISEFKNDISLLSVDGTELQGPGPKILAARTLNGVQPAWYCERNGATDIPVETGVPGQLRYVIPGLKTGEKYAIHVRAHNREGYGYAGSISPTFQIPRTTPSSPQAVELLSLSSRLLKLRWDIPLSNGGASITSYQVQWDTSVDFTNPMKVDVLVSSTDTAPFYYNIPVTSVMKYYVRVFAVNNQGDGAFAVPSPSSITPMDRTPGRPEDATAKVLSSYAILVEWKPSSTEKIYYGGDGGLPTTQYMVEWDNSPGFDSPPAFGLVDGTKRSYIIGGDDAITGVRSDKLVAGSAYSIRVTAFNAKGAGAPRSTTPASVTVTDQPPSSPQNLKLSVVTSTSVKADTNEEQVVRTTFTGLDEVQLITTTNSVVVDEVQTVVTSATDRNEVQELRLDGDDVDEIQAIRTSVPEVLQVQTLKVVVARTSEVQTITLTLPGAFATPATSIGGTIYFSFDSSICTHCVKKMYQRTINLVSSLQDNTATSAALTVKNALNDLANIDTVDVAGNVPTIGIDAAVTVGGNAVSGIPTQAAQITAGSEVDYASSAIFTVTYTCESYSDPYAITTFSTACTPSASDRICAGCVTSFLGGIFTVAQDLRTNTYVVTGAKLIAGVCSFEAGTVIKNPTSTTIAIATNDVGYTAASFRERLWICTKPRRLREISR